MLVVPAYAKVNLALEVVGRRADGYHDLSTLMVTLDWHDLVAMTPALAVDGAGLRVHAAGPRAGLGAVPEGRNLVSLAAAMVTSTPVWLELWKRIPVAAGLGGGSADAAAVLRALGEDLPSARLSELALALGSDVPFALSGGVALAAGRGERLRAVRAPALDLVVAVAGRSDTAAAYAALEPAEIGSRGRAASLADLFDRGLPADPELFGSALEPAALRAAPGLRSHLQRLRASVSEVAWQLTGSGGAAFALAGDRLHAQRLAAAAERAGFPARACRTLTLGWDRGQPPVGSR